MVSSAMQRMRRASFTEAAFVIGFLAVTATRAMQPMNRPLPEGWHNVTPRLFARDPEKLVQLLKDVFDATAVFETTRPSVLWIGDSNVMVSGVGPRGATSSLLYLYVDDTDATFRGALDAGASPIEAPTDTPCGDRRAMVRNPSGNDWQIATPAGGTER